MTGFRGDLSIIPGLHGKNPLSIVSEASHQVGFAHRTLYKGMHIFLAAIEMLELRRHHHIQASPKQYNYIFKLHLLVQSTRLYIL